jgi:hypothetical protein
MKIADLYEMTFEEFHAYVLSDKAAARILIGTEERFQLLKLVTKNNTNVRRSPKFYIPT